MHHKALIGFTTELRLRPRRNRTNMFLVATLRNDPNRPCGGGSVELSSVLNENCRSLQYQNQVDYGPPKMRRVEGLAMDMHVGSGSTHLCGSLYRDRPSAPIER